MQVWRSGFKMPFASAPAANLDQTSFERTKNQKEGLNADYGTDSSASRRHGANAWANAWVKTPSE
jgi:hypothetical protein